MYLLFYIVLMYTYIQTLKNLYIIISTGYASLVHTTNKIPNNQTVSVIQ